MALTVSAWAVRSGGRFIVMSLPTATWDDKVRMGYTFGHSSGGP